MTYITSINCFADAEARYNNTKPVVSKHHTLEQDVRPVGKRNRKWERVVRVDANTYALTCGGSADPVFRWGPSDDNFYKQYPITTAEIARLSPIVWRKHKDGTETITIRNGAGPWNHNHVYSFLARALPRELWFRQTRIGKQFIYNRSQGQTVHLPKTSSAPRHVIEYYKHQKNTAKGQTSWINRYIKAYTPGDDGLSVTFKREANGNFTLVGEAPKVMVDRTRMNKELKGSFKADIAGLLESAMAFYPMMRTQLTWALGNETNKELVDIAKEHKIKGYYHSYGAIFNNSEPELVRAILKDPEHPMRHGLNIAAMYVINSAMSGLRNYEDDEDMNDARNKSVRAHFNRWISKLGGFTVTTREEK
jgi:hypothetical protein